MRVLILPSFYPAADEPNRGVFFQAQAASCVRSDVQVHVLYYELRSIKKITSIKSWVNRFQVTSSFEGNLFVFRCHAWNFVPTHYELGKEIWVRSSLMLFKRYIKLHGLPDVIHVQSAFLAARVAVIIGKKYNIPYFINEHSTAVKLSRFTPAAQRTYSNAFNNADCIVAVSAPLKQLLASRFSIPNDRIRVIPNFIDTDFFTMPGPEYGQKGFRFLTVCFLEKKKRIDRLIQAFYDAFKHDSSTTLVIGGEGPERATIMKLIDQYQLEGRVTLLGSLSQLQVKQQMQQCDCFVLPSEVETFGVVLIEAMATGKPVIATRSGGPESFITPEVGILAENDLLSITAALSAMKLSIKAFKPQAIRDYVVNNFSAAAVSDKMVELYREIANR